MPRGDRPQALRRRRIQADRQAAGLGQRLRSQASWSPRRMIGNEAAQRQLGKQHQLRTLGCGAARSKRRSFRGFASIWPGWVSTATAATRTRSSIDVALRGRLSPTRAGCRCQRRVTGRRGSRYGPALANGEATDGARTGRLRPRPAVAAWCHQARSLQSNGDVDGAQAAFPKRGKIIDGNRYAECRFENCQSVYRGGEIPNIGSCIFELPMAIRGCRRAHAAVHEAAVSRHGPGGRGTDRSQTHCT